MKRSMGITELGWLFSLALMWGSSFLFTKAALQSFPPLTLVTFRMALSMVFLLGFLLVRRTRMPFSGRLWGEFLILSIINGTLPYFLMAWGQLHIDSSLAAILNSTTPISALVLAHYFTSDERITPMSMAGIALGFAGVVVLIGPDALGGLGSQLLGQLAVVGASTCYGIATVYGRRFSSLPPEVTAAGMQACSLMTLLPLSLTLEPPWQLSPTPLGIAAILCLGVLSTGMPFLVYFHLLSKVGATRTAMVNYLIPLVGVFWGTLLLGERLPWRAVPALLLVLAGLAAIGGHLRLPGRASGKARENGTVD